MASKRKKRHPTRRKRVVQTRAAQGARLSRREQRVLARKRKRQRQQLIIVLVAIAVVAVVAGLLWFNSRPLPLITVAVEAPTDAQGAAWGPPAAPVVIEDWSDFG